MEGCFNEHGSNHKEIYLEGITLEVVKTQGTIMQYADALLTAARGHVVFTADRISHALLSRKDLQKKT